MENDAKLNNLEILDNDLEKAINLDESETLIDNNMNTTEILQEFQDNLKTGEIFKQLEENQELQNLIENPEKLLDQLEQIPEVYDVLKNALPTGDIKDKKEFFQQVKQSQKEFKNAMSNDEFKEEINKIDLKNLDFEQIEDPEVKKAYKSVSKLVPQKEFNNIIGDPNFKAFLNRSTETYKAPKCSLCSDKASKKWEYTGLPFCSKKCRETHIKKQKNDSFTKK